ncbi:MAG TPA: thioredoxin family protein [Desulfomonilaceae bacterium]|nr:thioredoxin family protein [Desulfomonilaceae bacterium]
MKSRIVPVLVAVAVAALVWSPSGAKTRSSGEKKDEKVVWVVFFSSHDCPRCDSVKDLIEGIKASYPVRVKTFDVEKDSDYALFRNLQAIHSSKRFSVPLILVGETILMGEDEIAAKLDKTVRDLAKAGGAEIPYLGPARSAGKVNQSKKCNCSSDRSAGPPAASDAWKGIRSFFSRFF